MATNRRVATTLALVAATLGVAATSGPTTVRAQAWPEKPIRFIVPFTAGASPDVMARVIAEPVSRSLGQPVLIENRAGAGGNIAAEYVAKQPGDGYTVFVGTTGNLAVAKFLYANLPYDPATDFIPVSLGWQTWNVLIVPSGSPITSVQGLIDAARAAPGRINYGSPGNGTAGHLIGEVFKRVTGTQLTHIPYKGQNQVIADLLGGQLQVSFETIGSAVPIIQGGKVRALAVTAAERLPQLPDVPTFAETGVRDLDLQGWAMFVVPAKTPAPVVQRLSEALSRAIETPAVRDRINGMGARAVSSTPEFARVRLREEIDRWGAVVKAAGARAD